MPRKPRIEYPGGLYHIFNRSLHNEIIFKRKIDYYKFLEFLKNTQKQYPFNLYGYVIMPDHFHVLIEKRSDSVASIMKSLLSRYALYYNLKYNRRGHVFQGRYNSILVQKEKYLLKLLRYIHLEPVRNGNVNKPEQWEWSSMNEFLLQDNSDFLDKKTVNELFESSIKNENNDFKVYTYNGLKNSEKNSLFPSKKLPILGDKRFVSRVIKGSKRIKISDKESSELIKKIATVLCRRYDVSLSEIIGSGGSRNVSKVRALLGYITHIYFNSKITQIAVFLNKDPSAVTHAINKLRKNNSYLNKEIKIILDVVKKSALGSRIR